MSEIKDLDANERLQLIRFICSFAWADLEVVDSEKDLIRTMVDELGLDAEERQEVEACLKMPPKPEDIDPTDIPLQHRQLFLNTALKMVSVDGVIDEREVENFALFEQLLR